MKLTIRSHHATVDGDLHELTEKKLSRLERFLPRIDGVVVEVAHQETRAAAHRYAVQVTVHSGPAILRAEERAADAKTALELATETLSRQARRHKKRLNDRYRSGVSREPVVEVAEEPEAEESLDEDEEAEYVLGNVVRVKHFEAKPMSEEEALTQMDLIGHDFFIFQDAKTRDYALLYKRKDGGYGLLRPSRG
jgi:putative sigma-54 modulation protein